MDMAMAFTLDMRMSPVTHIQVCMVTSVKLKALATQLKGNEERMKLETMLT